MIEFVRTCGIGQPGHICGLRAIGMVAVQPYRDVFSEIPLTPGIVYLCKRHYYDPILEPDTVNGERPPPEDAECCASGRCEVCSPGYVWGRDG